MKKDMKKIVELYIQERKNFPWLISIEEFERDYVSKCECCGEYFLIDSSERVCDNCVEYFKEENHEIDNDPDWVYFEEHKEHFVYGL